ncbi:MAG: transcriptional regulator protein [Geminicoccaceae bacterium]|nr:transcriptional regulator protein [Geminicoccaceae bacterium]
MPRSWPTSSCALVPTADGVREPRNRQVEIVVPQPPPTPPPVPAPVVAAPAPASIEEPEEARRNLFTIGPFYGHSSVKRTMAARTISWGAKSPTALFRASLAACRSTPAQYRERFRLKPDYPMAAPNYVQRRREIALRTGLGGSKKAAPWRKSSERPKAENRARQQQGGPAPNPKPIWSRGTGLLTRGCAVVAQHRPGVVPRRELGRRGPPALEPVRSRPRSSKNYGEWR